MDYTVDELMAVCISRQIRDGEIVAQGIATPLVVAGYLLAKCTHAPNLRFASAIGQGVCQNWSPIGVARIEELWLGHALMRVGFVAAAADVLPRLCPAEFFRPAQVDMFGDFNNVVMGKDYAHPRLRLPGTGGIPDVTVFSDAIYLYVPRHTRVTFVPQLDYLSGLGHHPARRHGKGALYLISDLGQFDWEGGRMRVTSIHPGETLQRVQAKTGFELAVAPELKETVPPTAEELQLLREVIDPLNVRKLEMLGGSARRVLLHEILEKENVL
jgi:acyl CoA:acetate/3-ketoacid CoA transferase beta subunit